MQGCLPEGKSSLVVGEEGWWPVVVPVGPEEQGLEEQGLAPSPASAEGWACFPGNTDPGSGGRCLENKRHVFIVATSLKGGDANIAEKAGSVMAFRGVPSSSSTGTSWTNCSHQRRDDCLAVHSWMSNLQRRPARYMTATAIISGSH